MSTAQDFINSAAKTAGILAEGQALEAGVNKECLKTFNQMIQRYRNAGVDLGLPIELAADTVFVDTADDEAIELGLTLRLMVKYKRPIPQGLSSSGDEAFTELQSKYAVIREMDLDAGLTRQYLPHKQLEQT